MSTSESNSSQELASPSPLQDFLVVFFLVLFVVGAFFARQLHSQSEMLNMPEKSIQLKFSMLSETGYQLKAQLLREGKNVYPKVGDRVKVHYKVMFEDGSEVDSTYRKSAPLEFIVGFKRAIEGIDLGVRRIPLNGRARLWIPWQLGFGESGLSNIVPPKSNLIFELEVLEVEPTGIPLSPPDPPGRTPDVKGEGFTAYLLKEGSSSQVKQGDFIILDYTAWTKSLDVFHSSHFQSSPYVYKIGANRIPVWDKALEGLKYGSELLILVNSKKSLGKLAGFQPMVESFHLKVLRKARSKKD